MSTQSIPPDRNVVLASLRDYVEQLREEGMDGLPAIAPVGTAKPVIKSRAAVVSMPKIAPELGQPSELPGPGKLLLRTDKEPPPQLAPLLPAAPYRYANLEKTLSLEALREFIGECSRCKLAPRRTNLVFGSGNPNAELMFVGEAPGADEDLRGEPFVGRAGQLLTDIIERGMGMSRADVYICNIIKCRPPDNRNPEPDEVAACEPFLLRQIDLVRPNAIVGLGTFAVHALLKIKTPISKLRGIWHEVHGIKMMPTFHPAYLLRNPADKRLVWGDIQEVLKLLGRPIPQRRARD